MSHSKRNTSLAFFTSYERSLLRDTWGSQSRRLNSESFLPFASCGLCLLPAVDPVACSGGPHPEPVQGSGEKNRNRKRSQRDACHLFCRECAVQNLIAQRKEMKRLEREREAQLADQAEQDVLDEHAATEQAVRDFERVQMGLESKLGSHAFASGRIVGREGGKIIFENAEATPAGKPHGHKRKFELDEAELLRIVEEDRTKARRTLQHEKDSASKTLPSFWVPSMTPQSAAPSIGGEGRAAGKTQSTCPGSTAATDHPMSLKTLVSVQFKEENADPDQRSRQESGTGNEPSQDSPTRVCPACSKPLTNSSKAVLAKPCGHVVCGTCVEKFIYQVADEAAEDPENDGSSSIVLRCYVCNGAVSGEGVQGRAAGSKKSKKPKDKHASNTAPGLLDISSDGTGFAGGGKNIVKREGVAFQC